jgi:hypothetical protein
MGQLSSKTNEVRGSRSEQPAESAILSGPSGVQFGLQNSSLSVSQGLSQLQGEVFRQTRSLQQVNQLTYDVFLTTITEVNKIAGHFLDTNGKQLVFAVKKGTDSSFLWKATVRIACVKIDVLSKNIDSYRCLTLKQYLRVYNSLKSQSAAIKGGFKEENQKANSSDNTDGSSGAAAAESAQFEIVDAKALLDELSEADPNSLDECCICLERKPDVILPCTHSYCMLCIEQWNVDHKTCPVCRETLASTDDGWVISEGPDSLDVATEIQKSLMDLAH